MNGWSLTPSRALRLAVKNALNICSTLCNGKPAPLSVIGISTWLPWFGRDFTVNTRLVSFIAWMPLSMRFMRSCCACTWSAVILEDRWQDWYVSKPHPGWPPPAIPPSVLRHVIFGIHAGMSAFRCTATLGRRCWIQCPRRWETPCAQTTLERELQHAGRRSKSSQLTAVGIAIPSLIGRTKSGLIGNQ